MKEIPRMSYSTHEVESETKHYIEIALRGEYSNGGSIDNEKVDELLPLLKDARIMDSDTLELLPKNKTYADEIVNLLCPKDEDGEIDLPADEVLWVLRQDGHWWLQLWWD